MALLVDGVSKLGRIHWPSDQTEGARSREKAHQAENLRKMFLAMVDDIGVVLIKLADRLHNMRTLEALPPEKRKSIAQQTLEIYAPLANRLGIWQFKSELEDWRSDTSSSGIRIVAYRARKARQGYRAIHPADQGRTTTNLRDAGIDAEITGRTKHIYSIYRKMLSKGDHSKRFTTSSDCEFWSRIVRTATAHLVSFMPSGTHCQANSTITLPHPKTACISRCIRRSLGRAVIQSRSRSDPRDAPHCGAWSSRSLALQRRWTLRRPC